LDSAFEGMEPAALDEDDRQDLRKIAGRVGSLLRPPAPETAPAAQVKDAESEPGTDAVAQPEVPPASTADAQTANSTTEPPTYRYDEALKLRIQGVRTRQTRLNIQSPD
jgi:hypothetical protein